MKKLFAMTVAVLLLFSVLLGIPAAFVTYMLTFRGVNAYRQRRTIKLLRAWQARHRSTTVVFNQPGDHPAAFANANTLAELQALEGTP